MAYLLIHVQNGMFPLVICAVLPGCEARRRDPKWILADGMGRLWHC